jgi:NinB protein
MNALGQEARFLPELDGGGMFPVGRRSSKLTVKQFAALIELI